MITQLLAKFFGTKNERELKSLRPLIHHINQLESSMIAKDDLELTAMTNMFRERIAQGESLDAVLPEAFALVRETARRKLDMRHYDVQLIGGIILHRGKIAEMKTGEGKTLVATLALYLNALSGKGAHLVTVNDYLARRDAEWMRPIYNHLGLEVGVIQNNMREEERKKVYNADITYGTNNEFGFDYLRDNMKFDLDQYVQRDLNFAIVDEVDSILIDEARTPLIISGPSEKGSDLYQAADRAVRHLQSDDYEVDEKARSVHLAESGIDTLEDVLNSGNLYAPENILILHHVMQALRAHTLFKRDVDYVVQDNEVFIVDEFTGRIMPGRRYSDGLHQALEAKERVKIERENQTLASITLQNYFRLYKKLAGMTGTAVTEAAEFHRIYRLDVNEIPTHRPIIRDDQPDIIFLTNHDKFMSVIDDIEECHKQGQPVLVGTIAVETSEYLSSLLHQKGIPHNVLNAKNHAREADIILEAGEKGRVTIATNMAGRGTDIKLGQGVRECGGLRIIGTERHESRRIDNQLRGRSGRQGDPGSSKFYISLEDDLMRIFGGERLKKTMMRVGMKEGESIEHKMISRSIERAQEKVEKQNFEIRKNLLEYDDVLNQQRTVIYSYRRQILEGEDNIHGLIQDFISDLVLSLCSLYMPKKYVTEESQAEVLSSVEKMTGLSHDTIQSAHIEAPTSIEFSKKLYEFLMYTYTKIKNQLPQDLMKEAEKWILLETVDHHWKLHLQNIDHLKEGIGLRGYGQKNPLIEYKKESFVLFEKMMEQIKWDIIGHLFRIKPEDYNAHVLNEIEQERERSLASAQSGRTTDQQEKKPIQRTEQKIGRNQPCPCGSGKKYKHCCGR